MIRYAKALKGGGVDEAGWEKGFELRSGWAKLSTFVIIEVINHLIYNFLLDQRCRIFFRHAKALKVGKKGTLYVWPTLLQSSLAWARPPN